MTRTKDAAPCPFCRSEKEGRAFILKSTTYLECANCSTIRRHPLPLVRDRTHFYREEYAEHYLSTQDHPQRKEMLNRLLRRLGSPRGKRLLDMGAGNGLLVRLARDSGWEAEGTELSHQLRTLAKTRYGVHLRDPSEEEILSGSYDWVALINVLDQSPDPIRLLQEARKALRPEGRILIRAPNASFHVRWMRATSSIGLHRLSSLAVMHDYGFTRKSLNAFLPENGFKPAVIRNAGFTGSLVLGDRQGTKLLIALLRGFVTSVERISGRRALWGPSIEAEAERLDN